MANIMSIILILFGLSYVKSYGLEKKMNKTDLETYNWTKRLLVINLNCYSFFEDYKNKQYKKPLFLKNFGFWLIGYDGEVKSFSLENKFLYEIFNLIDQMPIRQQEILMYKTKC